MSGKLLLTNGKIYPGPPWRTMYRSLAVRNGKVFAFDEAATQAGSSFSSYEKIDLQGKTVLPGFIDSHIHLIWYGESLNRFSFPPDTSPVHIKVLLAEETGRTSAGEWIIGGHWSLNTFSGFPDRHFLDAVTPENPVALYSQDLHSLLLNSQALSALEITHDTPEPEGGRIVRDAHSAPTGLLREHAIKLFSEKAKHLSDDNFRKIMNLAVVKLHQYGITSVHTIENLGDWQRIREYQFQGNPTLRIGGLLQSETASELDDFQSGAGDDLCWFIGEKIFADGALGSKSAWLKEPYESSTNTGMPLVSPEELNESVRGAHQNQRSVAIHAIGDAAVEMALRSLSGASENFATLRNRIEHFQLFDPRDDHLFPGDLFASVQPAHMYDDYVPAKKQWGLRWENAYAFRNIMESGGTLCFGSDAPVAEPDPWIGIQAAVTRRIPAKTDPWNKAQKISLEEALSAYTYEAARAGYREESLGSLHPGKIADMIILNRDPFQIPETELDTVRTEMTIVDSEVVWSDG